MEFCFFFFGQNILFWNILLYFASTAAWVGHNIKQATIQEFPFIAAITKRTETENMDPERDTICTGSLITRHDVLTAEHCVIRRSADGIQVIVGSIDLVSHSRYYPAWWITYEQWACVKRVDRRFLTNDVSIIRLINNVARSIPFVIMTLMNYHELYALNVTGVGWGEVNNGSLPRMLQRVNLKVLTSRECEQKASALGDRIYEMDENLICTVGNPFATIMCGDSGGPLLYKNSVVAINLGTCPLPQQQFHPDKVNVHCNLIHYEQFILDVQNYS